LTLAAGWLDDGEVAKVGEKRTFIDRTVSREHRYSLGLEAESGQHYLSVPVSNQRVDYEEYYRIDESMFARFLAEPDEARAFAERCRRREEDVRLFHQPRSDRGTAR